MKVSELIRSNSGIARKFGACRMVKAGSNPASSSAGGRMNMLRENRLCQALSVIDPHRQAIGRIGAGVKILDEQLTPLKIGEHALAQALKALGRDRLVDLAPPHRFLGSRLFDDVFVARRAAGKCAGIDREAATRGNLALAAPDRMLVEHRHRLVPMHGSRDDACPAVRARTDSSLRSSDRPFHQTLPPVVARPTNLGNRRRLLPGAVP